jgi:hydrogenase maturation protease
MSVKLIAMGNMLMNDDAVGIEVAKQLEKQLLEKGIEVIYGETDIGYCISKVNQNDFVFILDAACYGKSHCTITPISLDDFVSDRKGYTQHSISFLDLLKLAYPCMQGKIFAIEVKEVAFHYGLSLVLQEKLEGISKDILNRINQVLEEKF